MRTPMDTPRTSPTRKRSLTKLLRMTPAERELFTRAADYEGLDLQSWLIMVAMRAARATLATVHEKP